MRYTLSGFNSDYIIILFYSHGNTGNHQNNFVRPISYILVHPSLQIREPPLNRVNRNSPHTDLVRDENKGCLLPGEPVELFLYLPQRFIHVGIIVKKEIGTPQGHAINDHDPPRHVTSTNRFFFFQIGPLRSPVLLMTSHPFPEFIIPYPRSSQINGILCQL